MKDPFIINTFHNGFFKYTGAFKGYEYENQGRKKPVIQPINKLRKTKMFPYLIDPEKNIKKLPTDDGEIMILIPTPDIPELSESEYKSSIWYKIQEVEGESREDLQKKIERKDDKIGKLRKTIRDLESEEEEKEKGEKKYSSNASRVKCPKCEKVASETKWEENSGWCPSCEKKQLGEEGVKKV